jgi:hypothetical protein
LPFFAPCSPRQPKFTDDKQNTSIWSVVQASLIDVLEPTLRAEPVVLVGIPTDFVAKAFKVHDI